MGESWVGGDLAGLQNMGNIMKPAPDEIDGVVGALSSRVDTLVSDAGWSGGAADAFRKVWTQNSIQVGGLASVVNQVGETIGGLGDQLQQIEADLYNAAHEAAGRGAQIGPKGVPGTLVITGDPAAPAAVAASEAQADYKAAYDYAMQLATGFRLSAAEALSGLAGEIEPGDESMPLDQRITIADYLRGLYVIPNEKNIQLGQTVPDKIETARDELRDARKDFKAERAAYAEKGLNLPSENPARLNRLAAIDDLKGLQNTLTAAEAGKGHLPLSEALNTKLGDVEKLVPGLTGTAPKGLNFLKDIPVVDVAASGIVAELQAQDDMEKGWSATEARSKDYGAAAIGLAAGAGTVAGAGAAASLAGATAPVWLTTVGAGFAVVGVGDFAYQGFHEHWSEDIHDRGVVSGIGHGIANVGSNTGDDLWGMGVGGVNLAKSLWDKAF
ncbi:WXG100 family type VII secretion target [Rhodococcus sp. NPDC058521]|uniref:WXG100 family type VII secretion target n=1 Tax=Rhodococcus sp. NPDC058521 TaxID=3346536 RepID=UPI003664CFC2